MSLLLPHEDSNLNKQNQKAWVTLTRLLKPLLVAAFVFEKSSVGLVSLKLFFYCCGFCFNFFF
jgi:hypothetical protein